MCKVLAGDTTAAITTDKHVCVLQCCSMEFDCSAVSCSVLQCLAVSFSVFQFAAVCCSALRCVAVCCSVLQ